MEVFDDVQNMEHMQRELLSRERPYHVAISKAHFFQEHLPKVEIPIGYLEQEDLLREDLSREEPHEEPPVIKERTMEYPDKEDLLREDLSREAINTEDLSDEEFSKEDIAEEGLARSILPKDDVHEEDLPKEGTIVQLAGKDILREDPIKEDPKKQHQPTEALHDEGLPTKDIFKNALLIEEEQKNPKLEEDLSQEDLPSEDLSKEGLSKENLQTEDSLVGSLSGQSSSLSLYVGNLNPRFSKEVLICMLKDILAGINVNLQRHDIEIIKKGKCAYAFVHLKNEASYQTVMTQFQNPANLEQSLLKELVKKGKRVKVGEAKSNGSFLEEKGHSDDSLMHKAFKGKGKKKSEMEEDSQLLSSSRASTPSGEWVESGVVASTKSESAIVHQIIVGKERFFFGALLGNETRNVEFKRGGGEYMNMTLKHHVRKYTCAFLNSEGGNLFIGVDDSGSVLGVQCNHKDEDRIRLLIDSILKGFKPPLFPEAYSLSFVSVIKPGDTGLFLKVIRLTVHRPAPQAEPLLYETDQGEVYLRRDGSVQGPLSGSAIQEWCRQKWITLIKNLEERSQSLLFEKELLQEKVHSLSMSALPDLKQKPSNIKKKSKSTVCTVM
ncbi:schlafen-like protein 1 [Ambystoma mexicanum]|uniref:schlafen-like protein 1 n=1 Tax=Ambystoma mexicanum TaxID=8296 RepID=UPI0037E7C479